MRGYPRWVRTAILLAFGIVATATAGALLISGQSSFRQWALGSAGLAALLFGAMRLWQERRR